MKAINLWRVAAGRAEPTRLVKRDMTVGAFLHGADRPRVSHGVVSKLAYLDITIKPPTTINVPNTRCNVTCSFRNSAEKPITMTNAKLMNG